jgi:hypothetical protein
VSALEAYLRFFEDLAPGRLDDLERLTAADVRFRDPFNDVRGRPALRGVLEKMFADVGMPRFTIVRCVGAENVFFVAWDFAGIHRRSGRSVHLEGVSEIHLDGEGRVALHIDHWDAARQIYERVPVLGFIVRRLRRHLSAG